MFFSPAATVGLCLVTLVVWWYSTSSAGVWQMAQLASSSCLPARCPDALPRPAALSARVVPAPVVQSMPSWQAPQASRLGLVFQLSACAALVLSWHLTHIFWPPPIIE